MKQSFENIYYDFIFLFNSFLNNYPNLTQIRKVPFLHKDVKGCDLFMLEQN